MYISKLSQNLLQTNQQMMTNEEFLRFQISQFQQLFHGELVAIKNIDLKYIAFSNSFAAEFNLNESHLGTYGGDDIDETAKSMIFNQEQQIINSLGYQDSSYFYKKDNSFKMCGMRKRQLTNPFTGDPVGLAIVASKFDPGFMRKVFMRKLFPRPVKLEPSFNVNLTNHQQQIAFCLLIGFHSRKEIAQILHAEVNPDISENKIKHSLRMLYHKFECNSTSQVLNLIAHNIIDPSLPMDLLPNGTNCPIE